jgi:hypothetical protein
MNAKRKSGSQSERKPTEASVDQSILVLKFLLAASGLARQTGKKPVWEDEQKWDILQICRHVATQPNNLLAGLLAAPVSAAVSVIEDLVWKTEVGLRSKNLNEEQRRQVAALSDQLDFALALIYRNLGYVISWRGRHTHNLDLFCEAIQMATGDGARAAQLIRRYQELHPEDGRNEDGTAEPQNFPDSFAWDTYQRVEELDRLADEFPAHVATAAVQMHGWPMLRQRHHDNRARFEALAERFSLGAEYPLDTSKKARFRPDTPMVRYLDLLVYRLHHICRMTRDQEWASLEEQNKSICRHWREFPEDPPCEEVLAVLRNMCTMPPLTKTTAAEWAKKGIVPLILATDARAYQKCKEPALQKIAKQRGVKSPAVFKSRLLAAIVPTLTSMARPG